jgi:hypothetical protein
MNIFQKLESYFKKASIDIEVLKQELIKHGVNPKHADRIARVVIEKLQ